jgi:hypothetical protein
MATGSHAAYKHRQRSPARLKFFIFIPSSSPAPFGRAGRKERLQSCVSNFELPIPISKGLCSVRQFRAGWTDQDPLIQPFGVLLELPFVQLCGRFCLFAGQWAWWGTIRTSFRLQIYIMTRCFKIPSHHRTLEPRPVLAPIQTQLPSKHRRSWLRRGFSPAG